MFLCKIFFQLCYDVYFCKSNGEKHLYTVNNKKM